MMLMMSSLTSGQIEGQSFLKINNNWILRCESTCTVCESTFTICESTSTITEPLHYAVCVAQCCYESHTTVFECNLWIKTSSASTQWHWFIRPRTKDCSIDSKDLMWEFDWCCQRKSCLSVCSVDAHYIMGAKWIQSENTPHSGCTLHSGCTIHSGCKVDTVDAHFILNTHYTVGAKWIHTPKWMHTAHSAQWIHTTQWMQNGYTLHSGCTLHTT